MKNVLSMVIAAMIAVMASIPALAQTRTVSGKVTDSTNQPVIGAAVMVKDNNSIGTVTDADGSYVLAGVPNGATLTYSFIGMETVEIASGNRAVIDVVLSDSTEMLEEMVVIGYGSIKKADLTGAVSVVDTKDYKNKVNNTIANALQGLAAGVSVRSTGTIGGLPEVLIRGTSSLTDNTPLYVIDGTPTANNFGFNVNDIETIQVLKDASAAAIYGSRAANGVIIITTKSGKEGKVSIELGSQTSVQWQPRMNLAAEKEWVDVYTTAWLNGKSSGSAGAGYADTPDFWHNDSDWQDAFFKTGVQQSTDLAISGGSKDSKFRVSISRLDNTGTYLGPKLDRTTASVTSEFKKGIFKFGESVQYGLTNNYDTQTSGISSVMGFAPIVPIYDDTEAGDAGYGIGDTNHAYTSSYNVVGQGDPANGWSKGASTYLRANGWIQVQLLKGLNFKTNLSTIQTDSFTRSWSNGHSYRLNVSTANSSATAAASKGASYIIENTLSYDNSFGKSTINAVIGQSAQKTTSMNNSTTRENLVQSAGGTYLMNVSSGTDITAGSGRTSESRLMSYFGRVNYSYDSRYLLQVTMRADGSSRFAPGNKWGFFPSVSAGWRVSQENFWNVSWMNDLKVRASYGTLGSQNVGDYDWMSLINSYTSYLYTGTDAATKGQAIVELANRSIGWETLEQQNYGVDMAFLDNRLLVTAEYYISKSKDCLYAQDILRTTGATNSPTVNSASLTNKGIELSVKWRQDIGDFSYSVGANISHNSNRLDALGYGVEEYYTSYTTSRIGYPLGMYYLVPTNGLFQTDEEAAASGLEGAKAGDVNYTDLDGDHKLSSSDRQLIEGKSPWPKLEASLNLTFAYKNWDLQVSGYGEFFKWVYNGWRSTLDEVSSNKIHQLRSGLNWWSESNKHNDVWYPNNRLGYTYNDSGDLDRWLERGDFFKFNSIALGYTWKPQGNLSKVFNSLRASLSAQNMITLTKFSGMDPDFKGSTFTPGQVGTSSNPNPYTVIFGLNMSF